MPRKTLSLTCARRERVEAIISSLVQLLDEFEPDADLEPDDSGYGDLDGMSVEEDGEPSLGWADMEARYGCFPNHSNGPDLELDTADDEDNGDREPSLGAAENHPTGNILGFTGYTRQGSQEHWGAGNRDDREGDEHDGREPDYA
jgi:hypothetical protein